MRKVSEEQFPNTPPTTNQTDAPKKEDNTYKQMLSDSILSPIGGLSENEDVLLFDGKAFATTGHLSSLSGRQSFYKRTFIASMFQAFLGFQTDRLIAKKMANKNEVVWFDTFSSKHHLQADYKLALNGQDESNPSMYLLKAYSIRKYNRSARRYMVTEALKNNNNIAFAFIDGVTDLIKNVTNESEVLSLVHELAAIAESQNMHICCSFFGDHTVEDSFADCYSIVLNRSSSAILIGNKVNAIDNQKLLFCR